MRTNSLPKRGSRLSTSLRFRDICAWRITGIPEFTSRAPEATAGLNLQQKQAFLILPGFLLFAEHQERVQTFSSRSKRSVSGECDSCLRVSGIPKIFSGRFARYLTERCRLSCAICTSSGGTRGECSWRSGNTSHWYFEELW